MGASGDADHVVRSQREVKRHQASTAQTLNSDVSRLLQKLVGHSEGTTFLKKSLSLRCLARIKANSPLCTNFQALGTSFNLTFQSIRTKKRKRGGPLQLVSLRRLYGSRNPCLRSRTHASESVQAEPPSSSIVALVRENSKEEKI